MLKLSREIGCLMRLDQPLEELGISTYDLLRDVVKAGDVETALRLIDYVQVEGKGLHDMYSDVAYAFVTWIADNYGEEKVPEVWRYCHGIASKAFLGQISGVKSIEQMVAVLAQQTRAHRSGPGESGNVKLWEEDDRYVVVMDPCGSGGRMRRVGELDKVSPRTGPPFNLGMTKKEYPWSWSMKDVPYYCVHCCVTGEIMSVETSGVLSRITDYDPDPNAPCIQYFYKKPEFIPEKYYERIGFKKPC